MKATRIRIRTVGTLFLASWAASVAASEATIEIVAAGRMTPLLRELAARYQESHPAVTIDVRSGDAAAGFSAMCAGKAEIVGLTNPAAKEELRKVRFSMQKSLQGFPIAADAVVLVVHPKNPVSSLTYDQIRGVFTDRTTMWKELGATMDPVPDHNHKPDCVLVHPREAFIKCHTPTDEAGLLSVLALQVLGAKGLTYGRQRHNTPGGVVSAVEADQLAIGVTCFSAAGNAKVLPISESADGQPVVPTPETIRSRNYPLTHYLYLYFAGQPTGAAREFLAYVLGPEGQQIVHEHAISVLPPAPTAPQD